ncbi:hypothetical protein Purlil1_4010 [Purpureocillium lilacinum]|uniref:Uncharacterized protein n=1 Tax=Purpureocillium lilacinum TaxID=33203 RepID=A0ABR0C5U0_PURLI|nr:hypothetical protein Purlil1_4010 [Purpureocillium lilacinum]
MQPHVPTTTAPRVSRRDLGTEGPFASQRRKHERIPGILRFPRSRNVQPDMQASSQPRTAVRPKASVWGTTRIPFYAATCASLLAREPARATCTGNDRSQDDERPRLRPMLARKPSSALAARLPPVQSPPQDVRRAEPPGTVARPGGGQSMSAHSSLLLDTADNVSDTAFLCPTQQGERPVDSPFGGVVSPPYASFRPQGGTSGTGAHEAGGRGGVEMLALPRSSQQHPTNLESLCREGIDCLHVAPRCFSRILLVSASPDEGLAASAKSTLRSAQPGIGHAQWQVSRLGVFHFQDVSSAIRRDLGLPSASVPGSTRHATLTARPGGPLPPSRLFDEDQRSPAFFTVGRMTNYDLSAPNCVLGKLPSVVGRGHTRPPPT